LNDSYTITRKEGGENDESPGFADFEISLDQLRRET
jgi:hypothetical protein